MTHDLNVRKSVLGKAICFLRLCRGITSVREADRIYRDRIHKGAPLLQFGSKLSKWERSQAQPGAEALVDALAVFGCGFDAYEVAIQTMMLIESKGLTSFRRSYAQNQVLRGQLESLAGMSDGVKAVVLAAAEEASARG